jgi:transcriptional regulator with PAS, ATPase and Fis domain
MSAELVIVKLSEAFSEIWAPLASAAGITLQLVDAIPVISGTDTTVLVAAGGEEEAALAAISELPDRSLRHAVVGSSKDYRLVASLLQAGAVQYFSLPGDVGMLHSWVMSEAQGVRERLGADSLTSSMRAHYDFSQIIGRSPAIREAIEIASRIIPRADAPILITGETGTGKELFAQAIHYNGPRAKKPLLDINCTALPRSLLESELFGYEAGAFTDARSAKPGLFEMAEGSTLLLDEIGDLPLELQPKLLRVLETGKVRRLGGTRETKVDFRIIASTHVDLFRAVRAGTFREDLFYRLHVATIDLPALRNRDRDVLELAEHFLWKECARAEIDAPAIANGAKAALLAHDWPGNVRELRNTVQRAVLLDNGIIQQKHILDAEREDHNSGLRFPATLDQITRSAAVQMLDRYDGNKSRAAIALGISRKYLYALLEAR